MIITSGFNFFSQKKNASRLRPAFEFKDSGVSKNFKLRACPYILYLHVGMPIYLAVAQAW